MKMRLKKRLAIILACVCAVYTLCPVSSAVRMNWRMPKDSPLILKNELDSINQELFGDQQ